MTGPWEGLRQHVIRLCLVTNSLVSGCGGNRDTRLLVRQALVLKILGFDDGEYVTHSENTLFEMKTVRGSRENILVFVIYTPLTTANGRNCFMLETK